MDILVIAREWRRQSLWIVAHGENWEVAASHVVKHLMAKAFDDYAQNKEKQLDDGSLEVRVTGSNGEQRSVRISTPPSRTSENRQPPAYGSNDTYDAPHSAKIFRF